MLNRIELKRGAKVITKSARVSAYQMTLLYLVIQFALSLADNYVSADDGTWVQIGDMQFQVQSLFHHAAFPTPVVVFVSVLVWLLGCVLDAGKDRAAEPGDGGVYRPVEYAADRARHHCRLPLPLCPV